LILLGFRNSTKEFSRARISNMFDHGLMIIGTSDILRKKETVIEYQLD